MKWVHSELEGPRGANGARLLSGHGLSYWTDGKEERLFYVTAGYRLVALDPKTGQQTYPPDTAPALQKYLELQPSGSHAQEATAMLQALGEKVQTKVTVPGATTKKKK